MKVHVALPTYGAGCTPEEILEQGVAAEALRFDGIASTDHLFVQPGNPERFERVFEAITVLSALAPLTRRVSLVTSVVILPMRNPFEVAKQAVTLDQMSGGRLILGLGAGWNEDEFKNLGADFHTRGRRLDEGIRLFRHLFSGSRDPFQGTYYSYSSGAFGPLPVSREKLPILVGGTSDRALNRAATMADIWESNPVIGPEQFRGLRERLSRLAGDRVIEAGARINVVAGAAAMREQASAYEAAGAEHLTLEFFPFDGFADRLRLFASEVLPALER